MTLFRLISLSLRPALGALAAGAVLAGCGHGGARSVLPAGAGPGETTSGHRVVPRSSNVDTFNGTLWYGDDRSLRGVALTYGPSAEIDGSYAGLVGPSSRAMTVSRDGTVYELIQNNADGPPGWQLRIYAPGTTGRATPELTLSGSGYSRQVFLVGDGIDVLTTSGPNGAGTGTLSTYAYGTASNAAPVRIVALGSNVLDAGTDRYDRIYIAHKDGTVTVYPAAATSAGAPLRTVATGTATARALAVSDDGTVYVLADDTRAETANVLVYAPANNGPSPSWTIGPFYESADVAPPGKTMSAPTGGITVDAAGDLYIGLAANDGTVRVEEYVPGQPSGTPASRTIATPAFSTYLTSLAIGPVLSTLAKPPPATLYVASQSTIYAFSANASGAATPQRTFGSLYYFNGSPPVNGGPGPWKSGALASIATGLDGTVTAVQNLTETGPEGEVEETGCTLTIFAPDASGTSGVLSRPPCGNYLAGRDAARGDMGEIDFLATDWGYAPDVVRTIDGAFASRLRIRTNGVGVQTFTTDAAGEMFVVELLSDNSTAVAVYNHLAQDLAPSVRSFALFAPPNYSGQALCAAPDGSLFGVEGVSAQAGGPPSVIFAVPPGGSSVARTFGSFTDIITALSCEAPGLVYVALRTQNLTSTRVEVYSSNASGAVSPLWTLTDPVPASDPGGKTITALALSPGAAPAIPGATTRNGSFRRTGPHGGRLLTP